MGKIASEALKFSAVLFAGSLISLQLSAQEPKRLLILSGRNNHDWQKTTPVLEKMFLSAGLFDVSVTNRPDTLKYSDYKKFRLVVGNWNSWPDTSSRWDPANEQAFERFIKEGGGALFLHAGGSSFYGWSGYHAISMGRWGKNTRHGSIGEAIVHFSDHRHPITEGLKDFTVTDEIWQNTDIHPASTSLGWVQNKGPDGTPEGDQYPAFLTNQYGEGRSFYTILGHDEKALSNPDLQQLLIRAAAWVSGIETSVSGKFGTYQFHRDRKPHFHPLLSPNGTVLTEESPGDHLWHMGLWFSWKFIDGLNYWEYSDDPARHVSEGMTEIQSVRVNSSKNGNYQIELNIIYHPWEMRDQPVMKEWQRISISAPASDKSFWIDYNLTFTALKDILLDRTPILGEPGGQSWGGYSGMSIRLNNGFRDIRYFSGLKDSVVYGDRSPWVACEFDNGTGRHEQVIIFDRSGNPRYPSPWYCINNANTPMYYFSPAILYREPMKLSKGEVLNLSYRIYLPAKLLDRKEIDHLPKK